jgi:hypothetical protein
MLGHFQLMMWVEGDEEARVGNQSEISRRDLTKQLSLFLPRVTTVSILPPAHHGKLTDQPMGADCKTKMIIFDYVSLPLAALVAMVCAIPTVRGTLRQAETDPKLLTLMHIKRGVT